MEEQQYGLNATPSQTRSFIHNCLATWEEGGKEKVLVALRSGLHSLSQSSQCGQNSLWTLVHALLSEHTLQPILPSSIFSSLLSQLIRESQINDTLGDEPRASSSRDVSPSDTSSEQELSDSLSKVILDVIWAVDYEIDSRKEFALANTCTTLIGDREGESSGNNSLDDAFKAAKSALVDVVRHLISTNLLTRLAVAERLETGLLALIGLIDDETGFNRKYVRLNTANLYKQQKFNLLREENEGYSGLISELIDGMGPPIRGKRTAEAPFHRVIEQESTEKRNMRAKRVMDNVSALIGFFDLDPNRVLDIILDVFSTNVIRHWPFFLALLQISPWSTRKAKSSERSYDNSNGMDLDVPSSSDDVFGNVDMDLKGDDAGHRVCAQVLGFKFGHYQQPDVSEPVPEGLYLMTAILLREGHISFLDLYNHLSADEKGMSALHEKYKQSMSDKVISARGNALSMAAPLTEESNGLGGSDAMKDGGGTAGADANCELPNQILGLLKAMLGIGLIKHSLVILGRYPWLCGAYPQVADLYSRLLDVVIEPAYSSISLATQVPVVCNPSIAVTKMRYDTKRQELVAAPPPQLRITSLAPEPLPTLTSYFIYFYPLWKEHLPRCSTGNLLHDFVPLLRVLGPHLCRNPTLFQKICRLGKIAMKTASSQSEDQIAWLEIVRNSLLPALTMTTGNSGLVSEVWAILRQLPYIDRYNLYGEWKYSLYRRPELRARQAETEKEAKGILKRISSDNVKQSGRALAKSSHTNPTIFFTVALNQIQSYSNLIAPIVESAKYLTHFEYDVFGFNLVDALSNPEKERTKQDGTSTSMWLQSLAAFTGTLYKRYAMMDCSPVLQYIANQLKENNSKDLVIIRELILKMAGIEPLANLSDSQIAALSGGRLLRMEAMMVANASIATPARVQFKKSGARLLQALMESRMAIPLLILIAQQRQACIHLVATSEAHLKYLGNLFDTCQEILFQYVEFIHNQLEAQAYSELIPSIPDLCTRFEVEPSIAFHIARPRLLLNLRTMEASENEERLRKVVLASKLKSSATKNFSPQPAEEDETMRDVDEVTVPEEAVESAKGRVVETSPPDAAGAAAAAAAVDDSTPAVDAVAPVTPEGPIWKAGLAEAVAVAEAVLPEEAKDIIGLHFYATFWQLGLADITVPTERYEQEVRSLQLIIDQNPEGGRKSIHKARIQAQDMHNQLRAELREQTLSHATTRKRLLLEKNYWFADQPNRSDIVFKLMQHCVVPRAILSPTDAIFAGKFIRLMHLNGTRNFSSLTAYDKIVIDQVAPLIFSSTENEIRNYARFLQVVLADLITWYKDENKFVKEAYGDNLPGFQMRWADRHGGEAIPRGDMLTFENFKTVMNKWQNMLKSIFCECLASKEYMRIRNTIVIMTRIARQFPMFESHGIELVESVTLMSKEEDRGDLKILGQGLLATLKKQQKGWIAIKKRVVVVDSSTPATTERKGTAATPTNEKAESTRSGAATPIVAEKEKMEAASKASPSDPMKVEDNVAGGKGDQVENGSNGPGKVEGESGKAESHTQDTSASSNRPSLDRKASATPTNVRGNGPRSPSVSAARQAALESLNSGMNPPRAAATTASAQASRARQSGSQRERDPPGSSTVPTRHSDRDNEASRAQRSPRSVTASRDPSPSRAPNSVRSGVTEYHESRKTSRVGSRTTSRAGSEEAVAKKDEVGNSSNSSNSRSERERERERDRSSSSRRERDSRDRQVSSRGEDTREKDRERDRDRSRRREKDSRESGSSGSGKGRGEDREAESRSSDRDRGTREKGERERERDRDYPKPHDSKAEDDRTKLPPTGPRLGSDNGSRRNSDYTRDRKDTHRNSPRQSTLSQQHEAQSDLITRKGHASTVPTQGQSAAREIMPESKEETGGHSPPSSGRKRSLADRLASINGNNGSASPSPLTMNEDESNKRLKTSRDRFAEEVEAKQDSANSGSTGSGGVLDQHASPRLDTSMEPSQTQQGISIHGQGRSSASHSYARRDTGRTTNQGRGGSNVQHEHQQQQHEPPRQPHHQHRPQQDSYPPRHDERRGGDRLVSSSGGRGGGNNFNRGNGVEGAEKAKDQRRRERRSGQDY
ncbi:hypothetical protein CBS101457_001375 [Exobasidium rhododendri]|nr:hypothetical protein CBS101457_001375 [Exobasidium rhododendri]